MFTLKLETAKRFKRDHTNPLSAERAARKLFPDLVLGDSWYQGSTGRVQRSLYSCQSGEREFVGLIVNR